ncbi:SAP protein, partial [Pitta sordida]|nr:SAP protein [Pitta sordida]
GFKCSLCTKVVKKIKKLAGDNPDEAALQKVCQKLGRKLGALCQKMVNKYQEQIIQGLQDEDTPQDICTAIGICK